MTKEFEKEIVSTCLVHIERLPVVRSVRVLPPEAGGSASRFDAVIAVETEFGSFQAVIEAGRTLTKTAVSHRSMTLQDSDPPVILFTDYVNPAVAEELKAKGMNFVDRAGNMVLNIRKKIYSEVRGRKPVKIAGRESTALFQPKGMRLLCVLLTDEAALNEPLRTLAKKSGIAFERAATAMKELKEKGYAYETKDGTLRWKRKPDLLGKWIANYGDRLRPKLVLGSYKIAPSALEEAPERLKRAFQNDPGAYAFGGGLAGHLLDHFYRGPSTEVFVRPGNADQAVSALGLIPSREPDVTLFNLFSPCVTVPAGEAGTPLVHPLLIYAELLHQGGDRAEVAAARIRERYLMPDDDEA